MSIKVAIQAAKKNQDSLLDKTNVVSVGVGLKNMLNKKGKVKRQTPCVVVGVSKKLPEVGIMSADLVPQDVDDVPISVQEMGVIRAHEVDTTAKHRPIFPGISIGHYQITAGTFGCVVVKDGQEMVLSNNHVLAACFDDETEVLVENGFKKWSDISMDDKFATLNTTNGKLEYQIAEKIHKYYYNGDLIHFKGKSIDCVVTPNHRMWAKRTYKSGLPDHCTERSFDFITAGEISAAMKLKKSLSFEFTDKAKWNCLTLDAVTIPKVAYDKGRDRNIGSFDANKWFEFLGWYLADGSYTRNKSNGAYIISIRSTKTENINYLSSLLSDLGLTPQILKCGAVQVNSKQLFLYLKQIGRSGTKHIPSDVKQLHPDNLQKLLDGYIRGDGFSTQANQIGAVSKSKQLSDDMQEIMFKLGMSVRQSTIYGSPYNPDGIYYRVDSRKRSSLRLQSSPETIPYSGYVYCATVPNGTLLTRRNGYLIWSGNSNDASVGDAIYQPGTYDGGSSADQIGTLYDFVPITMSGAGGGGGDPPAPPAPPTCGIAKKAAGAANLVAKGLGRKHRLMAYNSQASPNYFDAALATMNVEYKRDIPHIGVPSAVGTPTLGMDVQKFGRTTLYTTGVINQISVTVNVSYGGSKIARFEDQLVMGPMSAGGDSGSTVYDMDGNLVALLFAGSDQTTICSPISRVFEALNIKLPT